MTDNVREFPRSYKDNSSDTPSEYAQHLRTLASEIERGNIKIVAIIHKGEGEKWVCWWISDTQFGLAGALEDMKLTVLGR